MVLIGALAGGGAGWYFRAPEIETEMPLREIAKEEKSDAEILEDGSDGERAYVKMNNQFVIPILGTRKVDALVVLSLSVETKPEDTEDVYAKEAKLRDAFISVLFDFAYAGGFNDNFVHSPNLDALKFKLLEAAEIAMPNTISRVLITDIVRQDT